MEKELKYLENERQAVLATLVDHSHRFHQSFPYDVLYAIFSYLVDDFSDLWQCQSVCKRWRHFMMTWSTFWNMISSSETPPEKKSAINITNPCRLTHNIYLNGPLSPGVKVLDLLEILSLIPDHPRIKSICKIFYICICFAYRELQCRIVVIIKNKCSSEFFFPHYNK